MYHSIEPNNVEKRSKGGIDTQSEGGYIRFLVDEAIERLTELQVQLNPNKPIHNTRSIQPVIEACADATNLLRNVQRKMQMAEDSIAVTASAGGEDE